MSGLRVLIAGAGLSGATCARVLAEAGINVEIRESRPHVAGNCHTARCPETGVMEHIYGPHIFHTDRADVRAFVTRFARFRPYAHRVKARVAGQVFSLPVNLHSINQLFGTSLSPAEARAFIAARCSAPPHGRAPESFQEQALAMVGPEIYRAFLEGYTRKQWGTEPGDLPAAILQRLPLRFSYDDRYFSHEFQAIPEAGYTEMTRAILAHPLISLHLNRPAPPRPPWRRALTI
ncbi:UDP-galactopyranose mutase [Falsigemmobacter faecalis]|uniref:UDP-galactopyranose mutase n=1 Tax=Falsigemmobacter faecalis TaxID=2488730 RepID=UPI002278C8D6|nr:UDP-galactopyranose mutase [Falsigemmobacter faecalis]